MEVAKRNILVVDDEEPIRKVLKTHLTKAGYSVVQSSGGKGIFEVLEDTQFELLICDIKMPEVDGVDILRYTKEHLDTPVIMLTGLTDTAVAVDVMKKGAFDYVMKPVKKEDLLGTIQKALDYRDLLLRNRQLELENMEYQRSLEAKVEERTGELRLKAKELESAYGAMKSMSIQFVNVLAETIEAKDHYTRGHCNRMRYLCVELGRLAGLGAEQLELLEYASLLHDLGKVSVNELILNKQGPLTESECARVRKHPVIAEKILVDIPLMGGVASIVVAHHENFDGSGYPRGLSGIDIPVEARIIAVADLYDAMSSDRPYRDGLAREVVLEEMERVAGTQLDPGLVRLFIDNKIYSFVKN